MRKIVLIFISTFIAYANSSIQGDFNGDGVQESAYPSLKNCKDDYDNIMCDCFLEFSNPNIKPLYVGECDGGGIGMDLLNEGNLNSDGGDKIGLMRHWPTSAWRAYEIFSVNQKPKKIFGMSLFTGGEIESIYQADLVKKDLKRKGYVFYRDFNADSDDGFNGKKWKSGKLK